MATNSSRPCRFSFRFPILQSRPSPSVRSFRPIPPREYIYIHRERHSHRLLLYLSLSPPYVGLDVFWWRHREYGPAMLCDIRPGNLLHFLSPSSSALFHLTFCPSARRSHTRFNKGWELAAAAAADEKKKLRFLLPLLESINLDFVFFFIYFWLLTAETGGGKQKQQ